ncbi:MAG: hypothetical protein Tsb0021_15450 [Chlamydiales bacterium]
MKTLILDTSTQFCCVGLADSSGVIEARVEKEHPQSAQRIMQLLDDMCSSHKVLPQQLQRVILGNGPGSYTGMRVAAAVAKTIAYGLKIPLTGVCSLKAFAVTNPSSSFAVVMDARISGSYLLKGECHEEGQYTFCEPVVCSMDQLPVQTADCREVIAVDLDRFKAKHPKIVNERWKCGAPYLQNLWQFGCENFANDDFTLTGDLPLLYLRKTQAEIERVDHNSRFLVS